jgi:hypothetical protein
MSIRIRLIWDLSYDLILLDVISDACTTTLIYSKLYGIVLIHGKYNDHSVFI